jgi:hypothetical protein
MFVIVDLQIFHTQFASMFLIYLYTIFHLPSSSGSLVNTVKLKAKETFCLATMLLFYTQQNITFTIFHDDLLSYTISGPYIKQC